MEREQRVRRPSGKTRGRTTFCLFQRRSLHMSQQEMFPPQENRPPRQDNTDAHEQPYKQQWRGGETAEWGQGSFEAGDGGETGAAPNNERMGEEGGKGCSFTDMPAPAA